MNRRLKGLGHHLWAWAPEAIWCAIAVALLIVLVVLLQRYEDRPLPAWPLGLTLNTAVALITTVLRSVIVIAISEAISQLKWNRFASRERRLTDLYVFDKASRGPWGSFLMVLRGRGGIFGMAAAFVFVTGLATSTITQSAIAYQTRLVANPESRASILIRTTYGENSQGSDQAVTISNSPNAIENVAFQAVYQPSDQDWPMTEPSCPSGDCRWRTFDSLALCYDVQNITQNLKISSQDSGSGNEEKASMTLPIQGELYLEDTWSIISAIGEHNILNLTSPWPNLGGGPFREQGYNSFPRFRESVAYANDSSVLRTTASQWIAIYNNANVDKTDEEHKYRAAEFLWHFCVNTYNLTVTNGKPKTKLIATSTDIRDGQGYNFDQPLGVQSARNFTLVSHDGRNEFRIFDNWDVQRLDMNIRSAFEGGYSSIWGPQHPYNEFSRGIAQRLFAGVNANMTVEEVDKMTLDNLKRFTKTVSDGITDYMRKKGTTQEGTTLNPETFVSVRWTWLAFVAAQVGLSIGFLLSVACYTAHLGVDVVKGSNFAELFALNKPATLHANLPPDTAGIGPVVRDDLVARLRKTNGTWELDVSRKAATGIVSGVLTALRGYVRCRRV